MSFVSEKETIDGKSVFVFSLRYVGSCWPGKWQMEKNFVPRSVPKNAYQQPRADALSLLFCSAQRHPFSMLSRIVVLHCCCSRQLATTNALPNLTCSEFWENIGEFEFEKGSDR